jgi:small multidrug resistance family-3 protein
MKSAMAARHADRWPRSRPTPIQVVAALSESSPDPATFLHAGWAAMAADASGLRRHMASTFVPGWNKEKLVTAAMPVAAKRNVLIMVTLTGRRTSLTGIFLRKVSHVVWPVEELAGLLRTAIGEFVLLPAGRLETIGRMKIFLFVLFATIFESTGDAIVRVALHHSSMPVRIGLFLLGAIFLALYGTSLNLAPIDFAAVTGMYVATLFVVFQVVNYVFFHTAPTIPVLVGGALIATGGLVVSLWQ